MKQLASAAFAGVLFLSLGAHAQSTGGHGAGPSAQPETATPIDPQDIPTVDEMVERLRTGRPPREGFVYVGEPTLSQTNIRRGDVVFSIPVRPARVGRLDGDLMQGNAVQDLLRLAPISEGRVVLPAGTPVYHTALRYSVSINGIPGPALLFDAWCGVTQSRMTRREIAYCALFNGEFYRVAVPQPSPYLATTMSEPAIAAPFSVTEDQSAARELPSLEFVYTFAEFDARNLDLRRGIRVNGGEIVGNDHVTVPLQPDRSALIPIANGQIRVTRDRGAARVEEVVPVSIATEEEEEAVLRQRAEQLVAEMIARAQAGPSAVGEND